MALRVEYAKKPKPVFEEYLPILGIRSALYATVLIHMQPSWRNAMAIIPEGWQEGSYFISHTR